MANEPIYDTAARDTSTSSAEGRLKSSFLSRKKKNKIAKKMIKSKPYGSY